MSPTEFSSYIKQRAMQQQIHQGPGQSQTCAPHHGCNYGPIRSLSPARSLSPNSLMSLSQNSVSEQLYYPSIPMRIFSQLNAHNNNLIGSIDSNNGSSFCTTVSSITNSCNNKSNNFLDPFYNSSPVQNLHQQQSKLGNSNVKNSNYAQQHLLRVNIIGSNESVANKTKSLLPVVITNSNNKSNGLPVQSKNDCTYNIESQSPIFPTTSSEMQLNIYSDKNGIENSLTSKSKNTTENIKQDGEAPPSSDVNTNNNKLIEGLNLLYPKGTGSYQQLLVAN